MRTRPGTRYLPVPGLCVAMALALALPACGGDSAGATDDVVAEVADNGPGPDSVTLDNAVEAVGDTDVAGDPAPTTDADAVADNPSTDPGSEAAAEVVVPEWSMGLPPTSDLGTRRQYSIARTIIHLHNVFSHDACDGQPRMADGTPNEVCHQQLRAALCADHIDFAMMTDHTTFVEDTDTFADLYMFHDGDTWEDEGGVHSANVMPCQDGTKVRFAVGMENDHVSLVGLLRHPVDGDQAARAAAYGDYSPAGVKVMRDAGAVPVVIHIEDYTDAQLDAIDADMLETCNLHILLAPNIRKLVGLDPEAASTAFATWLASPDEYPAASDLVFLEFHQRVAYYMDQWDRELGLRMMGGFAGNDAHQNVLNLPMADGERPDSYRRMMKWYVNHALVESRTGTAIRAALHARRLYEVFELVGTPADFDFHADQQGGSTYEMGQVVPAGAAVTLRAPIPHPLAVADGLDTVRMVLRQVTPAGATTVYDGPGPVEYASAAPGRYRLEVFLTPQHLAPYLGASATRLLKEYPWIYSNPIEVQ